MVGIVIVSHSRNAAEGAREIAAQMAPEVSIAAAGGTADGRLGTDINSILKAIREVYTDDGVLIIFDLGSAYMNAEMAVEMLDEDMRKRVEISDAAMVEGAAIAAVNSGLSKPLSEIMKELKHCRISKMP
ncbi:dihydroxyacetone kinase phosphoryl donor subunit DhaM [Anaerobium acetethylicum]|uniref:phosphoenolpyruvate--glycerone phosphotransferase n=1 Tax=Anaerobium acetethylicum TaxID=1619234 RepID=A0A1D3TNP9_9FIRM|nr:dihydroxyacetone kinase phosphoryl donor subunit DhaM [Anaerobium acetethylicum]SCP94954.1 dihydroxyacetone kinase, phosphotransfer subunit [Anaerobium acetethylicum]